MYHLPRNLIPRHLINESAPGSQVPDLVLSFLAHVNSDLSTQAGIVLVGFHGKWKVHRTD
jgi:hypothetical protein